MDNDENDVDGEDSFTDEEEEIMDAWNDDVFSCGEKIDPENEYDWFALAYGYMLGREVSCQRALELSLEVQRRGWM